MSDNNEYLASLGLIPALHNSLQDVKTTSSVAACHTTTQLGFWFSFVANVCLTMIISYLVSRFSPLIVQYFNDVAFTLMRESPTQIKFELHYRFVVGTELHSEHILSQTFGHENEDLIELEEDAGRLREIVVQ